MKLKLEKSEIVKVVLIAVAALLLLFAVYKFFFSDAANTTGANAATAEETRLCGILSEIDGVGKVSVIIHTNEEGETSVVVVCQGADSLMTRSSVLDAVKLATGANGNDIRIYKMNE